MSYKKNVAGQKLPVLAINELTGVRATGDAVNISCKISKDGGASASTNDAAPTELDNVNQKGFYLFDLTQAETNCDMAVFTPTSSTPNIILDPVVIFTYPDSVQVSGINSGVTASLVDEIWNEPKSGHTTANTYGAYLDIPVSHASGAGGSATLANQQLILAGLGDIKGSGFLENTDSLESIRNRGDIAWITATGFSTHSAADVWAATTRTLTGSLQVQVSGIDPGVRSLLVDEIWDEPKSGHTTPNTFGSYLDIPVSHASGGAGGDATIANQMLILSGLGDIKGSGFVENTDSLESIRNRGDLAWLTATGFSTHSAADVWAVGSRTLTGQMQVQVSGIDPGVRATLVDEIWDEPKSGHITANTFGAYLDIPISHASGGGGDATLANQTLILTGLSNIKGSGFAESTDSLENIRNRGDIAWITATGFSTHSPSDIWSTPSSRGLTIPVHVSGVDPSVRAVLVDEIWDELKAGHTTPNTFGSYLDMPVSNASGGGGGGDATLANQILILSGLGDIKGSGFVENTDSLESIRNRGDISWTTATGFSTHSAADVWASVTRTLTDSVTISGIDPAIAEYLVDEIWDEPKSGHTTPNTFGSYVDMPISHASGGGGDATLANQVLILSGLGDIKGSGFVENTDSLESIRNRGDISWITATGFSTHSAADVWTSVLTESYAASGAAMTGAQMAYMLMQGLTNFEIVGTEILVRKLNGTTEAMSFDMDDATTPTRRIRGR